MSLIHIGPQSWTSPIISEVLKTKSAPPSEKLGRVEEIPANMVEADGTAYYMPKPGQTLNWYLWTTKSFRFAVKMHEDVTHKKMLQDARAETEQFIDGVMPLKEKLAYILIQMPPYFDGAHFASLETFLAWLPTEIRFAVEIRHRSWMDDQMRPRYLDLLTRHRVAHVLSDSWNVDYGQYVTTDFSCIRLNADNKFMSADREIMTIRIREREKELDRQAEFIRSMARKDIASYTCPNDCFENNAVATIRSLWRRLPDAIPPCANIG